MGHAASWGLVLWFVSLGGPSGPVELTDEQDRETVQRSRPGVRAWHHKASSLNTGGDTPVSPEHSRVALVVLSTPGHEQH